MIIDLSKDIDSSIVDSMEWEEIEVVTHSANTASELATIMDNLEVGYPSSIINGEFVWDYKDCNTHIFNIKSSILSAIEGLEIIDQSEGPRYWFVSFTYKGEISGFGPGYN